VLLEGVPGVWAKTLLVRRSPDVIAIRNSLASSSHTDLMPAEFDRDERVGESAGVAKRSISNGGPLFAQYPAGR